MTHRSARRAAGSRITAAGDSSSRRLTRAAPARYVSVAATPTGVKRPRSRLPHSANAGPRASSLYALLTFLEAARRGDCAESDGGALRNVLACYRVGGKTPIVATVSPMAYAQTIQMR